MQVNYNALALFIGGSMSGRVNETSRQMYVRIPHAQADWVDKNAKKNGVKPSGEVRAIIRKAYEADQREARRVRAAKQGKKSVATAE